MPQNIHHLSNRSIQNKTQTGAREQNLILSVKTACAIIFQCLDKLTVQKMSSFYGCFHNRVLLQGLCSVTDRLSYTDNSPTGTHCPKE